MSDLKNYSLQELKEEIEKRKHSLRVAELLVMDEEKAAQTLIELDSTFAERLADAIQDEIRWQSSGIEC